MATTPHFELVHDTRDSYVVIIAKTCHEMNRLWCYANGDLSQPTWEEAPDWQKASAINGVHFHITNPDASPSASHESWYAEKEADGWVYGEIKDPEAKTHPCMVPFSELPVTQQYKDIQFKMIVTAMLNRDCQHIGRGMSTFLAQ